MSSAGFAFLLGAAVLISGAGLWGGFHFLRRLRLVQDTPTSRLRSAAQGYVELQGRGALMDGAPIVAPLTGRTCTWYRYQVEKREVRYRNGRRESHWRTLRRGSSDGLFLLEDGTGECVVDPEGAEVTPSAKDVWYGHAPQPSGPPSGGGLLATGDYRYREERMHPGDPLYAIGLFRTVGGAGDLGRSADEVKELLRSWKQDPARMRQIDRDGDGTVDLAEWDAARQAAEAQVAQARAERAATPGTNLLGRPLDRRRPFILSVAPQEALEQRYRWLSIGALVAFFAAGSFGVWALGVRLG